MKYPTSYIPSQNDIPSYSPHAHMISRLNRNRETRRPGLHTRRRYWTAVGDMGGDGRAREVAEEGEDLVETLQI